LSFDFYSFLNYSGKGTTPEAILSQKVKDSLKNAENVKINYIIKRLKEENSNYFDHCLGSNKLLVPVPNSAKRVKGGIWNTRKICSILCEQGLGHSVEEYLLRHTTVEKSSHFQSADQRTSVKRHLETISVSGQLHNEIDQITLVDDILTLGRTTYASAYLLQNHFPNATIRVFAIMRNQGLRELRQIEQVIAKRNGRINFNEFTGKTKVIEN
jgi:predicted amidophosphoribosyltransferase